MMCWYVVIIIIKHLFILPRQIRRIFCCVMTVNLFFYAQLVFWGRGGLLRQYLQQKCSWPTKILFTAMYDLQQYSQGLPWLNALTRGTPFQRRKLLWPLPRDNWKACCNWVLITLIVIIIRSRKRAFDWYNISDLEWPWTKQRNDCRRALSLRLLSLL